MYYLVSFRRCGLVALPLLSLGLLSLAAGTFVRVPAVTKPPPLATRQATAPKGPRPPAPPGKLQARYAQLPLSFEVNEGQFEPSVQFVARGRGYTLALSPREAVVSLRRPTPATGSGTDRKGDRYRRRAGSTGPPASRESVSLRMKLLAANPKPEARAEALLPGKVNYLLGNDPSKWRSGVSTYGRVRYREVYPGIDLTYYGSQGELEYDFILAPGADPDRIRFGIDGARKVEINRGGDLVMHTEGGEVIQKAPVIYQEVDGARKRVAGKYELTSTTEVGFHVPIYDATRPLVIDPVLSYSTYLGGGAFDSAGGVAVDGAGNAYVAGATYSANYPTRNPLQPVIGESGDAFITKLNPAGTSMVYSTYLGGSGRDFGVGVAVDGTGAAYVVGLTDSIDFPTRNPIQAANGGGFDAFVAKLNPSGSALAYSTYIGGTYIDDHPGGIAVTGAGEACITGWTTGVGFPTRNAIQGPAGQNDVFVTKLDAAGSGYLFSTYFGGARTDLGRAIALDPAGNIYVTGKTESSDLPTPNGFQRTIGADLRDAFVAKLTPTGSALVYGTYLGGSRNEDGTGIAVDAGGNAYAVGVTNSLDFPTQNPLQATPSDSGEIYITKLDPGGSTLLYSTYLGGSEFDECYGVAVDTAGNLYVSGDTASPDFPVVASLQAFKGIGDAFVAQVNPSGSALVYNTLLGGAGYDYAIGVAVDPLGNVYAVGTTSSADFPTLNALQPASGGGTSEVFAVKLNTTLAPPATHFSLTAPVTVTAGTAFNFTLTARDAANNPVPDYSGTVRFTSTDNQAELPADYTFVTGDAGAHVFSATLKTTGAQTLTGTDTAKPTLNGNASITVTAGVPADMRFGQQPSTAAINAVLAPAVTVRIVDAFGNTVTTANDTVTLALSANPGSGTLNGTTSRAAVSGIATFNNLSVDKPGNGYTLAPSGGGLPGPFTASAPFNITTKPATQLRVTAPATANSGTPFQVTVTAVDADNQPVTTYTGAVRWTSSDPQAVLPPDYTYTAADAGAHVFTVTLKTLGSRTITVTDRAMPSLRGTATVNVTEALSFVVTTALDTVSGTDGVTSLREAINASNARTGLDTITFKIPGAGLKTIAPTTALPTITDPTVIDGYTQPGARPNTEPSFATNATLVIEINGAKAAKGVNGLTITAGGTSVRGLVINRFRSLADGSGGVGIVLKGAGANTIAGCFLGTVSTGKAASGNAAGVLVEDCSNNMVGGTNSVAANLISGNELGVTVGGDAATGNVVRGNVIGTNAAGTTALGGFTGVDVEGPDNQVGPGNLISGHTGPGIFVGAIEGTRVVSRNRVIGNRIGTDVTGRKSVANANGVNLGVGAVQNQVGGITQGERNLISGNRSGVNIFGNAAEPERAPRENQVLGNYIGADASGAKALPNATNGVSISRDALDNLIGGDVPGARNVISGNRLNGIVINGMGSTGNRIQGNYIGLDANGSSPLPNAVGIRLASGTVNNSVGAATADARNVISGNKGIGIEVDGIGTLGNVIQGNYIGLNALGSTAVPNATGIQINVDAANTLIGGTAADARNVISGNKSQNVWVSGVGTNIQGNYIGTDARGTRAVDTSNSNYGVFCIGSDIRIGGSFPGAGNLISGNGLAVGAAGLGIIVQGNKIGTNVDGSSAIPNNVGISIAGTNAVLIGGVERGAGNLISGNTVYGVDVFGTGHVLQGNFVGTNAAGTGPLPNRNSGIFLETNSQGCLLGGEASGAGNLISGNSRFGVTVTGRNNTLQGNFIGTNAEGTGPIPNLESGCSIRGNNNILGGAAPGAGNLFSGNGQYGLRIVVGSGNRVQGNFAGTNAAGTGAVPNGIDGINVSGQNNVIGGTIPAARNLLSGNNNSGIALVTSGPNNGSGNAVLGNYIGTDVTGTRLLPNEDGVYVVASTATVGGTAAGAGNLISGNRATGISLRGAKAVVLGNLIGTDRNGALALPNGTGVSILGVSNLVGGLAPGAGNRIAFNVEAGVAVVQVPGMVPGGNTIRGNALYLNGGLGIDLIAANGIFGVTLNDPLDKDLGANGLQNSPVVTDDSLPGAPRLTLSLNSVPNATFVIDVYGSDAADPSGYGEGQRYLGSTSVTTNSAGNVTLTLVTAGSEPGTYFTATASRILGVGIQETGEFSNAVQLPGP